MLTSDGPRSEAAGDDFRRLPRAHQRAGEHDVERRRRGAPARAPPCACATCRPRSAAAWHRRATRRRALPRRRGESDRARTDPASISPPAAPSRWPRRRRRPRAERVGDRHRADRAAACSARGARRQSSSSDSDERVEIAPDGHVRRRQRRLHLPHALDQHLQVVHPAEQLLSALQRIKLRGRAWRRRARSTSSSA